VIAIKVFDKSLSPLTTFLEGEFSNLSYTQTLGEIGDCSFALDFTNAKVTEANLQHYNRLQVMEDDTVLWSGFIAQKTVKFNLVEVRCKELIGILKKRLTDSCTLNGQAGAAIGVLLGIVNSGAPSGIVMGEQDVTAAVNMTYDRQDAFSILTSIAAAVDAQFEVTTDGELNFKMQIGRDLSATVIFRYNVGQIAQANILKFEVDDSGDEIVTKAYGKSSSLGSTQTAAALQTQFGLLEAFRNFQVANTQSDLDALTASLLTGPTYSPAIDLAPSVPDNFSVGDTVRVQIANKLIALDDAYYYCVINCWAERR
jgi:hypothetical protein